MSQYYVVDSTIKKNGKNPVVLFSTTSGVVKYLEGMCLRQFKRTRTEYMTDVETLGHGADERTGRSFYDQMEQYFNIGVIRKDSTPVKTNVFQADAFFKSKAVNGN